MTFFTWEFPLFTTSLSHDIFLRKKEGELIRWREKGLGTQTLLWKDGRMILPWRGWYCRAKILRLTGRDLVTPFAPSCPATIAKKFSFFGAHYGRSFWPCHALPNAYGYLLILWNVLQSHKSSDPIDLPGGSAQGSADRRCYTNLCWTYSREFDWEKNINTVTKEGQVYSGVEVVKSLGNKGEGNA